MSHKKWICAVSNFITVILHCQMLGFFQELNSRGLCLISQHKKENHCLVFMSSTKCENRKLQIVVEQWRQKMYKKAWCTCKVNAFLLLLLPSSLHYKLANKSYSQRTLPSAKQACTLSGPLFPPKTSLPRTASIQAIASASSSELYFASFCNITKLPLFIYSCYGRIRHIILIKCSFYIDLTLAASQAQPASVLHNTWFHIINLTLIFSLIKRER